VKVVIVAPHFSPRVGGVETYTLHIATELIRLGWQVVIVTTGGRADKEPDRLAGLTIYRLPAALTISNTPVGWRWRRRLRRIYAAERPDVINAHTPVPYLADLAERASGSIPFVLTYHNDLDKDALIYKAVLLLLYRVMIQRTLRRSDRIIVTSAYYVTASRYLRVHQSRIRIVPPGVDLSRFNPGVSAGDQLGTRYAGERVILFVGSLNRSQRYKGLDVLIHAFAQVHAAHQDTRLVIAGDGDGIAHYRRAAAAAGVGDAVEFTGYLPHERLAGYYQLATVLAMPSTSRTEGFGMVFAEAGAVGTPVIGSAIGGIPYAIRHEETGLLVAPSDIGDLCRALRRVLDDEALAQRLGAAGAARARAEYDWRPLAQRTSEILAGAAGQRSRAGGRVRRRSRADLDGAREGDLDREAALGPGADRQGAQVGADDRPHDRQAES
jgi:glycosyltransferase involved in cell wall biosynthesis